MRRVIVVLTAFMAGVLGVALLSVPASADIGRTSLISPGSTVCTSRVQSSNGVNIQALSAAGVFTVLATQTVNGPETEVFRQTTGIIETPVTVTHPDPGVRFYRFCAHNPQDSGVRRIVLIRIWGNGDPNGQSGIGSSSAVLTPSSVFCDGYAKGTVRFVATSNVPVRFFVQGWNGNRDKRSIVFEMTGTAVDQTVTKPSGVHAMEACVSNPQSATSTATVSFDMLSA